MTQEVSTQGPSQSDDDERYDDHGHDRVRRQDGEINRARNSLRGKPRRAVMGMLDDVGTQKEN